MSTITSLSHIPVGHMVKLNRHETTNEMACRLCEIGLTVDSTITIVSNRDRCPLIVKCRDTQLMISRQLSEQIEVTDPER